MKKVTLFCLDVDRDATLERLRELGVVHLVPVQAPAGDDLDAVNERLTRIESASNVLAALTADVDPRTQVCGDPAAIVEQVHELVERKRRTLETASQLRQDIAVLEPFGDFDPALAAAMQDKGLTVRLFRTDGKDMPAVPEGVTAFVLRERKNARFLALLGSGDYEFDAVEQPLPDRSLSELRFELAELEDVLAGIDKQLSALAAGRETVESLAVRTREVITFLSARDGMGRAERVLYLQGFAPDSAGESLRRAAGANGWGLAIEEPGPDEPVPTLIRTPRWATPIKSLFTMLEVLPGYHELDVSVPFLIFFTVFFGMIVGDAGYGLLYLVMTVVCRRLFPRAPSTPFRLLGILSTATIVWGALTGNYLGFEIPALSVVRIDWLLEERNLFTLCFLMGSVHLTVAHLMQAVSRPGIKADLEQVGWISMTWFMYFLARQLIMAVPGPSWMLCLLIAGGAMIIVSFLLRIRTRWMGLATFAFDVIGNFSDVVSYIRLYAVGAASLAVAQAFNDLALGNGVTGLLSGIGAAVILFIGHALNMVLCIMSVLVHGVRLNTLEFSGHAGLAWTGVKYEPFATRQRDQA